jgi:hypothetical protein
MSRTANHPTSARRRIGVLVFAGAAAGLVTLAVAPGSASANPDTVYVPYGPGLRSVNLDAVALNPQPLPPEPPPPDLSLVALNPQPLPPGPPPPDLFLALPRLGFS